MNSDFAKEIIANAVQNEKLSIVDSQLHLVQPGLAGCGTDCPCCSLHRWENLREIVAVAQKLFGVSGVTIHIRPKDQYELVEPDDFVWPTTATSSSCLALPIVDGLQWEQDKSLEKAR